MIKSSYIVDPQSQLAEITGMTVLYGSIRN